MKAIYRLSRYIAGFDFYFWMLMQKAHGATEIVFDTRNPTTVKWPMATVKQRIKSILLPGPALAGMASSIGTEGDKCFHGSQADLVNAVRGGLEIPRLKSVLPPGKERYTVTLRKTQRSPTRNSDEAVWREFAKEIGALVIPDYEDKPIHLHERMALYAGAEMNFFVTNGPVILCFFSEYPAMSFEVHLSPMKHTGVPLGVGYPFLLKQHQQIYEMATPENIRKHFYHWRETGTFIKPIEAALS